MGQEFLIFPQAFLHTLASLPSFSFLSPCVQLLYPRLLIDMSPLQRRKDRSGDQTASILSERALGKAIYVVDATDLMRFWDGPLAFLTNKITLRGFLEFNLYAQKKSLAKKRGLTLVDASSRIVHSS